MFNKINGMSKPLQLLRATGLAIALLIYLPLISQGEFMNDIVIGCQSGNVSLEIINADAGQMISLEDPVSIDSIIVIGFSRSTTNSFPTSWSFTNSTSTAQSDAGLIMTFDIRRYFAKLYGATSFVNGVVVGGTEDVAHPHSYTAYVFRSGSNYGQKNIRVSYSQEYLIALADTDCEQKVIPLFEAAGPRDIEVAVILDDVGLTTSCSKASITATAGTISYVTEAHLEPNSTLGANSHIHNILLENVPGDATQLVVEVCSIFSSTCGTNGGAGQGLSFQGIMTTEAASCNDVLSSGSFYFACDETENTDLKVLSNAVQNDLNTCVSLGINDITPSSVKAAEVWLFGRGTAPTYITISNDLGYTTNLYEETVLAGGGWEFRTTMPLDGADDYCVKTYGGNQNDLRVFSAGVFYETDVIQSISGEFNITYLEQSGGVDDCYTTDIAIAPGANGVRDLNVTIGLEAVYNDNNQPVDIEINAGPVQFFQTFDPLPIVPPILQAGQISFTIQDVPGYVEEIVVNICSKAASGGGAIFPSYIYVDNTGSCRFPETETFGCAGYGEDVDVLAGYIPSGSSTGCIDLNQLGFGSQAITSMKVWAFTSGGTPNNITFMSALGAYVVVNKSEVWNVGGQGTYYVAELQWDGTDELCATVTGNPDNLPVAFGAMIYSEGNWNDGAVSTVFMADYLYHGGFGNDCYNVSIPLADSPGTNNQVDLSFVINDYENNGKPIDFYLSYGGFSTGYTETQPDVLVGTTATFNFSANVPDDVTEIEASICSQANHNGQSIFPTVVIADASDGCCLGQINITTDGNPDGICQWDGIMLYASTAGFPEGTVYKWYRDGSYVIWGDGPSIMASNFEGTSAWQYINYSVEANLPNGCIISNDIELTIIPETPIIGITDGIVDFCIGDVVALDLGIYYQDAQITNIIPVSGDESALPSCTNCLDFYAFPNQTTTYQVFVNYFGCENTYFYTLLAHQPIDFTIEASTIEPQCAGESVILSVSSDEDLTDVTYRWYKNGQLIPTATTNPYEATTTGYYTVEVISTNDCKHTEGMNVVIAKDFTIEETIYPILCASQNSGSILLDITGENIGPFTYLWENGYTGPNRSGLGAGNYSVTVTDNYGCEKTESYQLAAPNELNVYAVGTPQLMAYTCESMASANVGGGVGPYFYSWDDPQQQQTQVAFQLCPGTYNVVVTDQNGCTGTNTVTIEEVVCDIEITNLQVQNTCSGENNGSIQFNASSDNDPLSITWKLNGSTLPITGYSADGLAAATYQVVIENTIGCILDSLITINEFEPLILNPIVNGTTCYMNDGEINLSLEEDSYSSIIWSDGLGENSSHRTGLSQGTYVANITDNHGCEYTESFNVSSPSETVCCQNFVFNPIVTAIDCFGDDNGAINLNIAGGQEPLIVYWSDGNTSANRTGMSAGSYAVMVQDAYGCVLHSEFELTEPTVLEAEITGTDVTYVDGEDGTAAAVITGGVEPYQILWTPGNYTTTTIDGLSEGNYNVIITDANGCQYNDVITINGPECIDMTGEVIVEQITCNGYNNGSIEVVVNGNDGPFVFEWNNANYQGAHIHNLAPGTYQVLVTDQKGCTLNYSSTIIAPAMLTGNISVDQISCNNANDGALQLNIAGGTLPYTIDWNNSNSSSQYLTELGSGNYSVLVTDANDCTLALETVLENPALLDIELITATSPNCSNNGGFIDVEVTGGTGDYTYNWSDDATINTEDRQYLGAGNYSLEVTDGNGCIANIDVNLIGAGDCTGSIGDLVFVDTNANGVYNVGEELLSGIVIYLVNALGEEISTITNSSGSYLFTGLEAGSYTVYIEWPISGFTATTPLSYSVNLAPEQDILDADFGLLPPVMSDLSLSKVVNISQVQSGGSFYYTLILNNSGTHTATNIQVIDVLPSGVLYASSNASSGTYDPNSSIWAVSTLGVGQSVSLQINVHIGNMPNGSITNTAQIASVDQDDPDSTPSNNNAAEDDQASAIISVYTPVPCEPQTVCTEPMTPITICPNFCTISGPLEFTNVESTFHCSINPVGNCVVYTPLPQIENYGNDFVSITACDENGVCETITVTVTFGCNENPIAVDDNGVSNGNPVTLCVLTNDYDPDNDGLSICNFTQPTFGTIIWQGDCVIYTPISGYVGQDCFTYSVCDNANSSDLGQVCIQVTNPFQPCSNEDIYACTGPMEPIEFCPDFCNLQGSFEICDHTTMYNCSIVYLPNGCIRYTPLPAFIGSEIIALTACSGTQTDEINIHVTVGNCNGNPPIASDDYVSTIQASPTVINVLVNDLDPDGGTLDLCGHTNPSHGTVIENGNSFTYISSPTFSGTDSFTYTICNEAGESDIATVYINVEALCTTDEPQVCVEPMEPIEICLEFCNPGVSITSVKAAFNCSVTILNENCFRFISLPLYEGTDILEVEACLPGNPNCEVVNVFLTVGDCDGSGTVQFPPVANTDIAQTVQNISVSINVLENDSDSNGDNLYICNFGNPNNGQVVNNNGILIYTPNQGFLGTDYFTYNLCDGSGAYDVGQVQVTVGSSSSEVHATDDSINYLAGNLVVNVLANDSYPNSCIPQITVLTQPTLGTISTNANGSFTISNIPNNYVGTISFTYNLCACNICDSGTVFVNVLDGAPYKNWIIPNVFTPNGDGVNDNFEIREVADCHDCQSVSLTIIDANGKFVFKKQDFLESNVWDGMTSNGQKLPNGTYYYLVEIDSFGKVFELKGFVEIRN